MALVCSDDQAARLESDCTQGRRTLRRMLCDRRGEPSRPASAHQRRERLLLRVRVRIIARRRRDAYCTYLEGSLGFPAGTDSCARSVTLDSSSVRCTVTSVQTRKPPPPLLQRCHRTQIPLPRQRYDRTLTSSLRIIDESMQVAYPSRPCVRFNAAATKSDGDGQGQVQAHSADIDHTVRPRACEFPTPSSPTTTTSNSSHAQQTKWCAPYVPPRSKAEKSSVEGPREKEGRVFEPSSSSK